LDEILINISRVARIFVESLRQVLSIKIIAGCKKRNKADAGVNEVETEELADIFQTIHQLGITKFLVEHGYYSRACC